MKKFYLLCLSIAVFFSPFIGSSRISQAFNPHVDVIKSQSISDLQALIGSSDLIVYGRFGDVKNTYNTSKTIHQGKLMNYIQTFKVKNQLKGQPKQNLQIIETGVEPQPKPRDPINLIYTGPLTSDYDYVCFLKKVDHTPYYKLNGGWSGVYPYINGKTISLVDAGIKSLDQLTLEQLRVKIKASQS